MIRTPKVFLVRRDTAGQELVQRALNLTPVAGALAPSGADALAASTFTEHVLGMQGAPLAVVAEFEHPLVAVFEDGTIEVVIEKQTECPPQSPSNP
jgi:hypothetical protein